MTPVEVISILGLILLGIGLAITWIRNGKSQAGHMAQMETRQDERTKTIYKKLDDPNTGLGAIKKAVDKQEVRCAGISSGFQERIRNLEDKK